MPREIVPGMIYDEECFPARSEVKEMIRDFRSNDAFYQN